MTRFVFCVVITAITLACWKTDDASAQWIHAHHHQHHGIPLCGRDVFVWDWFVDGPVVQQGWLTPLNVVVPQTIEVVPMVPAFAPPLVAAPIRGDENFARQEMIVAHRPPAEVGDLPLDFFNDPSEIRRRANVLKPSSPGGRIRADQLISSGDQAFADQKLARAVARYREAIAKAPDYAEAHFRLAHAYVATRRYNLALKSLLVALELSATSRRDGFSLEDIYQGDLFAREQHLKRLVDASRRDPTDGGLRFLIGFTLHFDGQRDLGQDHFRAARDLDGIQQAYVRYFLPVEPIAEPAEAAN